MITDAPMAQVTLPAPTGALLGYARRSTGHQTLEHQHDALSAYGVPANRIYDDTMSGARDDRPGLAALLAYARPGDAIVVVALDRLGRTIAGIFRTVETLAARGIHVRTIRESIDTSTALGRMLMSIFAGLAEYERTLIAERALAARESAALRGKLPGRPRKLTSDDVRMMSTLRANGETIPALAARFKVSRATTYRILSAP